MLWKYVYITDKYYVVIGIFSINNLLISLKDFFMDFLKILLVER